MRKHVVRGVELATERTSAARTQLPFVTTVGVRTQHPVRNVNIEPFPGSGGVEAEGTLYGALIPPEKLHPTKSTPAVFTRQPTPV